MDMKTAIDTIKKDYPEELRYIIEKLDIDECPHTLGFIDICYDDGYDCQGCINDTFGGIIEDLAVLAGRKRTAPPRIIMIETICNLLKKMWTKPAYSDWRLGQLIVNLSRDYNGSSDPFFLRDQPLIEMLRERGTCND